MANSEDKKLAVDVLARVDKLERGMAKAAGIVSKRAGEMEGRLAAMSRRFDSIGTNLGDKIAKAFAAVVAVRAAKQLIDSAIGIQNALKVAGLEGENLKKVYDQLFASAQKNAVPLEAMVTLYGRVAASAKELGASQEEVVGFSEKIGLALRVSGQSAAETSGAMLQLSQALGGGKIQMEEYGSLLDGGRPILQAVAAGLKEAGGSVSGLTALVKAGKVSSEAFFRAFLAGSPQLEKAVASSESTISQRMVRLQNVLVDAAGEFNNSTKAGEVFGRAIDDVATGISSINFDNLISQVQAVVAALNSGAGALQSWAAGVGAAIGADRLGEAVVGALSDSGTASYLGGAVKVTSSKIVGDRINQAFDAPAQNNGALTPEAIRNSALGGGVATTTKTPRLPAADVIKPVSLANYSLPASSGAGGGSGRKARSGGGGSADDFAREVEQIKERTSALTAMTAAQAAVNPLTNDYGESLEMARTKQELLTAAQKAGKEITPALASSIDTLAASYAAASAASEKLASDQDKIKAAADDAMGTAKDVTKGFINDLRNGSSEADALKNALSAIADKLLDGALDSIFGGGGSSGGGILGALFSSIGGGGVAKADPWAGLRLAGGGRVSGPGSATSDSIPAMLSDGEHVTRAAMVRKYGPLLDAINSDRVPHLASGGLVAPRVRAPTAPLLASRAPAASALSQPQPLVVQIQGASGDPHVRELVRQGVQQALADKAQEDRRSGFGAMQHRFASQKG